MDRIDQYEAFVAVADCSGFAPAARKLHRSPPSITRAIAALETHMNAKLFHRTTRHVRLTDAGERLLEHARSILEAVDHANEAVAGVSGTPQGHLKVTAPQLFGRMFVMPGIVDYLERYPNTRVTAMFVDRITNLIEEGLDVAIRIGRLPDSTMFARKIGEVRVVVCATPVYLQQNGRPTRPLDLRAHSVIASYAGDHAHDWHFEGAGSIGIRPRLMATTNDAVLSATLRGFGLSRLLSYQIAEPLKAGKLEIVLEKFEPPPRPIHLVHREPRTGSAKVRRFVELMADRLNQSIGIH